MIPLARLAGVLLLVCDVDGVLTDGRLDYGPEGEGERKHFHVRDGLGLRRLLEAGIHVAWITARGGPAVERRAKELGIQHLVQKSGNKAEVMAELAAKLGVTHEAIAYVGDDLVDRDAMKAAGIAIAPSDAHAEIRAIAHWVTSIGGGRGAVREICDAILHARGHYALRGQVAFRVGRQLIAAIAMGTSLWLLTGLLGGFMEQSKLYKIIGLGAMMAAAGIIYFGLGWLIGALNKDDVMVLLRRKKAT